MDLYNVLGVPRSASADDIKAAFRDKALKYHPDRHADSPARTQAEAARLFKQVKDAYEVLSDGAARSVYNKGGRPGAGGFASGSGQAPRGPAGQGGAYGSGYGDPFASSCGFGTPRARSGWSNFRYQQRQYNRHDWFFRPFAAAARGLGRGDTVWHAAVGGVVLLGFLAIAPLADALWESQNSGKLFQHISSGKSSEEAEERLRRRVARMRGSSYPSSAVAAAGALPKFQAARSAAAAAAAQASGRVDALKPSVQGLADPAGPAPGRADSTARAPLHALQGHGERAACPAAAKPLEHSAAPGPSGPASLPDPLGPVLAAVEPGGAGAQPEGSAEAGSGSPAAAQPHAPADTLLPPAAAAAVPPGMAANAGGAPAPQHLPSRTCADAGPDYFQLGMQLDSQQGSGEQQAR